MPASAEKEHGQGPSDRPEPGGGWQAPPRDRVTSVWVLGVTERARAWGRRGRGWCCRAGIQMLKVKGWQVGGDSVMGKGGDEGRRPSKGRRS